MIQKAQFDPQKLYMIPLGGSGEIGMNLNAYIFGGKILVVDVGVTFERLPGIEVVMPNIEWLSRQKKHIVGIVFTHAHEDHVGAIGHLWPQIVAPIYATPFTAEVVRHKLKEAKVNATVAELATEGVKKIGPFNIQLVNLTHSIPEPSALAIQTSAGVVVHTGDWKIDPAPLVGKKTNEKLLKTIGKKGVLALVCDSTCVFERGWSGSEEKVRSFLTDHLSTYKTGRVVVACFASNIARLFTCYQAAESVGRKVLLAGRSLERMSDIARKTGYFDGVPPFLKDTDAKGVSPDKLLIVATGSQGESRAALRRMACGSHPKLHLDAGDVVIFSSRTIPGNEKEIFALQNQLVLKGVKVVTPKQYPDLHVSGHPSRDELKKMYSWLQPRFSLPVHGEARHLLEHASFAKSLGVEALPPRNGDVILLDGKTGLRKVGEVVSGRLGLDGNQLVPVDSNFVAERRVLAASGVVFATVCLKRGRLVDLMFSAHGVGEPSIYKDFEKGIKRILGSDPSLFAGSDAEIKQVVAKSIRTLCFKQLGKKPHVEVHILGQ